MRTPFFQVDAFASQRFAGNPAAVMPMASFPEDAVMQAIAAENNLAETAFLVREDGGRGDGDYRIRWFTPLTEVPLCGHATLASAAVVMERLEPARQQVVFHSESGPLAVRRGRRLRHGFSRAAGFADCSAAGSGSSARRRADRDGRQCVQLSRAARESSGRASLTPDMPAIAQLDRSGLIVTARGDGDYDFVSRYFAPAKGIPEDPVTGAAHCMLAPFWAGRLGKTTFRAFQASRRGGELVCRLVGDRVELEGSCVFYVEGLAEI